MTQPNPPPRSVTAALRARPAAAFAICLVPGIALRDLLPCRPWLWMICLFAFLVLSAILHRRTRFADLALALAIALVGLLAAQIAYFQYPANHVWIFTSQADRFAQLDMKIDDPPRLIPPAPDDPRLLGPKQTVRTNVVAIQTRQGRRPAVGAVSLFLEEFNPRLAPGQIVRATGILERPSGAMNPGEFDFAAWERSIRTLASLRVSHAGGGKSFPIPDPAPSNGSRKIPPSSRPRLSARAILRSCPASGFRPRRLRSAAERSRRPARQHGNRPLHEHQRPAHRHRRRIRPLPRAALPHPRNPA